MVIIELLIPKNRTYTYDSGENINSLTEILSFHTAWCADRKSDVTCIHYDIVPKYYDVHSRFKLPKNLSTGGLSQQLPLRLMLAIMPCCFSKSW